MAILNVVCPDCDERWDVKTTDTDETIYICDHCGCDCIDQKIEQD